MGFQPSGLFGFLEIDFKGEADTGRLTLNHVFSTPINQVFCLDMGVDATLNFITLAEDSSGDDLGTEVDLLLTWACTDATSMEIGYASFSSDADEGADEDFFYLGTGWSF